MHAAVRVLALVTLVAACKGEDPVTLPTDSPTDTPDPITTPDPTGTTFDDVAPIFEARCTSCHAIDGIGTFPMEDYETTRAYAELIKLEVTDRTMPPWFVNEDGSCGSFMDSRWLTDDELATIVAWVDEGARPGLDTSPLMGMLLTVD